MNYKKKKISKIGTGKRISEILATSHYSYDEISKMLELSSSRIIYYWINGKKMPSIDNLVNLSSILNIKIEDILVIE